MHPAASSLSSTNGPARESRVALNSPQGSMQHGLDAYLSSRPSFEGNAVGFGRAIRTTSSAASRAPGTVSTFVHRWKTICARLESGTLDPPPIERRLRDRHLSRKGGLWNLPNRLRWTASDKQESALKRLGLPVVWRDIDLARVLALAIAFAFSRQVVIRTRPRVFFGG